ncbi:tautomerase family protein [Caloranaerobacter ferrireducens]|uniref:tautomerase family protein n=1 Tax=Caloranaerobacter ferrireducens TaxID=1323370 RepID=UPI00084CFF84|nr:tautomerase family protein [Caloranaerobacter ferrireducens]
MPQVKIHISSSIEFENKSLLVKEIRESIPQVLGISQNIGQVMLYESPKECRSIHESRDINFVFVETTMYPGRSKKMKEKLMQRFIFLIHKYTGVDKKDIICVINEIPPENYYGGTSHKYIEDFENS